MKRYLKKILIFIVFLLSGGAVFFFLPKGAFAQSCTGSGYNCWELDQNTGVCQDIGEHRDCELMSGGTGCYYDATCCAWSGTACTYSGGTTPPPVQCGAYPQCKTGSCGGTDVCRQSGGTCKCVGDPGPTSCAIEGMIMYDANHNQVFDDVSWGACGNLVNGDGQADCTLGMNLDEIDLSWYNGDGNGNVDYHNGCDLYNPKFGFGCSNVDQGPYYHTAIKGYSDTTFYLNFVTHPEYKIAKVEWDGFGSCGVQADGRTVVCTSNPCGGIGLRFLVDNQTSVPPVGKLNSPATQSVCIGDSYTYTGTCTDSDGTLNSVALYSKLTSALPLDPWTTENSCSFAQASTGNCSASKMWSTLGDYYMMLNCNNGQFKDWCTGNPWCEWDPLPNSLTCNASYNGASDCDPVGDQTTVTVESVADISPNPPNSAPSCPLNVPTLTLNWNIANCADNYVIRRCVTTINNTCDPTGNADFAVTATPSYTDNSVALGSEYCYRVRGRNDAPSPTGGTLYFYGNWSNIVCNHVAIAQPVVSLGTTCVLGDASCNLTWPQLSCAPNYDIERCLGGTCSVTNYTAASLCGGGTCTRNDNTVLVNNTYNYRVRGCLGGSCGTYSTVDSCIVSNTQASCSTTPTYSCDVNGNSTGVNVVWSAGTGCLTGYNVYRCTGAGCTPTVAVATNINPATYCSGGTCTWPDTSVVDGTIYRYGVSTCNGATCRTPISTCPGDVNIDCPFCDISPISSVVCSIGEQKDVTVSVNTTDTINNVDFSYPSGTTVTNMCNDGTNACVNNCTAHDLSCLDGAASWTGTTLCLIEGSAVMTALATVTNADGTKTATCSNTANVDVSKAAWFQSKGGDVTADGNIVSKIPTTISDAQDDLILGDCSTVDPQITCYPGVLAYNGTVNVTPGGDISSTDWNANSRYRGVDFTYDAFYQKLPVSITGSWNVISTATLMNNYLGTTDSLINNYHWFYRDGDLSIDWDQILTNDGAGNPKKVVLFVNGDLTINKQINISAASFGRGFFMAVVSGNINIGSTVGSIGATTAPPHLEGIYFANGTVYTGIANVPLRVRGMMAAGGFSLQRNLYDDNDLYPGEYFEFASDLIFNYPSVLSVRNFRWKEVAP